MKLLKITISLWIAILCFQNLTAQFAGRNINWLSKGNAYLFADSGNLYKADIEKGTKTLFIAKEKLIPAGKKDPLALDIFLLTPDNNKLVIFTNTAKVWRYNTRGDYWVYDLTNAKLMQLGKSLPSQSLMFAKISPDGKRAAYVSGHNIYSEDLTSGKISQLTKDGARQIINGTFDWVYEEEFDCRDGFRWSPDSKAIAFWRVDARKTRDYYMLNTTDSVYSRVIPVEYPKVGQPPSAVTVGVVSLATKAIKWMNVLGDPQQYYIPVMEWAPDSKQLILQQLNRKQNESNLMYCNSVTGIAKKIYTENDTAWIDIKMGWRDDPKGWSWVNDNKDFIWVSEKDGWRHIYRVAKDGASETLLTKGGYDIGKIVLIDRDHDLIYFMASPQNATESYLYKTSINGDGTATRVTPQGLNGTHSYEISPDGKFAYHGFSSINIYPSGEWLEMENQMPFDSKNSIAKSYKKVDSSNTTFFKVTIDDSVTLDAWITKPKNFDSTKKYPVVFSVYTEPAASTVINEFGGTNNFLYKGDLSAEGYFQISVDNRGTPSLRGTKWRKAIYKRVGQLNIHDQAMAAKKILDKPWFDKDRVAVWGWSGGGSATLNLMFQYPEIYKTGIAIAPVSNLLYYDNIYTERYSGLEQEDMQPYIKGSPITYAKNLKGNLLLVHGTGDDNVHYSNAEALINELVKYNKTFQVMPYPNRTHNISEGEGTREHLANLYTAYLKQYCPGGGR